MHDSFYERYNDLESHIYIGRERPDRDLLSLAHYHIAVELCIPLKGEIGCCINGNMQVLQAGEIAVIESLGVHYFDLHADSEMLAIVIEKNLLNDFFAHYRNQKGEPCFELPMRQIDANRTITAIALEWEKNFDSCNDLQNKGFINLLFGEITKHYPVHFQQKKADHLSIAALQYIREHFKEEISLERLAKHFAFSRNTVSRILHALLGEDLRSYINRLRVQEARKLLQNEPEMTVELAAKQCGFQSMNVFYRAYTRYYGETPKRKDKKV